MALYGDRKLAKVVGIVAGVGPIIDRTAMSTPGPGTFVGTKWTILGRS